MKTLAEAPVVFARAGVGIALAIALASLAWGQGTPPKGGRGGPPEEAFTACEGLKEQASCPITTPEGSSVTGLCMMTPDKKLACTPEGGPPQQD